MITDYRKKIIEGNRFTLNRKASFLLQFMKKKKIIRNKYDYYLDAGSGYGHETREFAKIANKAIGIDLNKSYVASANKHATKKIKYEVRNICQTKFHSDTFDLITSVSVIEHIPEKERAVKEAYRILKKDGTLIYQIPNRFFFVELHTYLPFLFIIPKSIRRKLLRQLGYSNDAILASEFSLNQFKKILKKHKIDYSIYPLIYPVEVIPSFFRPIYHILNIFGAFKLIPFGYVVKVTK